ncbi:MAG: hypothetical protein ACOYN5_06450 [Bacteroidales bacterium]
MKKIVYLFGAGASKNSLPIVDEIPEKIESLIEILRSDAMQLPNDDVYTDFVSIAPLSKNAYQKELISDLEWLVAEVSKHASVDTFAKKLFIQRNISDLNKLKVALSLFFVFQQAFNKPDNRYDAFFASIHNRLHQFPENIRILSWNYDSQFELAYSLFSNQTQISDIQNFLNIKHKYGGEFDDDTKFGIYKLNGTTGLYRNNGSSQYIYANFLNVPVDLTFMEIVVRSYVAATYEIEYRSNFSFAWEGENPNRSIVDLAVKNVSDCIALVVIGYSFPFFNRDIDRKIINSMTQLKSVYFQAPDADNLIERFSAVRNDISNIKLIPKFDLKQFVLPNEL